MSTLLNISLLSPAVITLTVHPIPCESLQASMTDSPHRPHVPFIPDTRNPMMWKMVHLSGGISKDKPALYNQPMGACQSVLGLIESIISPNKELS